MLASNILAGIVALLHIYFLYLEMFLWAKPKGLAVFKNTLEKAKSSAVLAANQGLYNGFLAAGLLWGLMHPNAQTGLQVKIFFFSCVIIAGVYGAITVGKKILYIQAFPAAIGLVAAILALNS